ncbi:PREDICTED: B-cell differentiation antigen CD72 [Lipotes vexillifer]|uniref:B-cell differentiation antigen CD72 n=1 Tax=Lipotes vexillifer TaxID=118797 RepID=A0A340X7T1_LIPVE|nr:PREDICTED: B-cell differentiation antigen CD72 [Lipotes vexillifer]
MAEAITYADLRFVKAPLKKSISSRLGQDPEADEDGELTYENVQVPPGPGGPSSLASAGLGDKAGVQSEQPTAAWSPVTSPAAGRILPCKQYLFLGLLLTCLLLGVAAICLGVHYFQVSQQLQQMNRVLEATNSTLRQQLRLKITQLGQREEDLQGSRSELAQSQERLQVEQKVGQATKEQLQACQSDGEKTKEDLRNKEIQRMNLEQRLSSVRDTLKPFFTCPSPGTCCPLGWIPNERSCFYISITKRSWEESQRHCKSLSSELAKISDTHSYGVYYARSLRKVLAQGGSAESYWVDFRNKFWQWSDGTRYNGFYSQSQRCVKVDGERLAGLKAEDCHSSLPFICELEAFSYPDGDPSLH